MRRILLFVVLAVLSTALDNGVGLTPPMGWNSWNHFGCFINETIIKQTADLLVSSGLAAKGYKYLNLDDCWQVRLSH
jgi:alpha-galactosidase